MKVIKEDLSKVIDYGNDEINQKAEKLYDLGIVTRDQLIFSLGKNDIVDLYNKHFDKNGKQTRQSRYSKIKEDIENLERVKNKQTVQNVVMADAEEQSKMDKEVKDLIDPKERKNEKAFLGANKQPVPKAPEEAKATLDESLFEDTNYDISDIKRWVFEDLDNMLEGNGGLEDNLVMVMSSHVNEYDPDWGPEEFNFSLANELKKARENYINTLMKMLFINAPANESLKEDLNEVDFSDFNSDFYNAIADVLFKYREHEGITRNDVEKAYAFFNSHFYDSDDNEDVVDEDLDKDDNFLKFKKCHPEYNKKFDNKKFGKFFDKNGKLKPEMEKEFKAIKISEQVSEEDLANKNTPLSYEEAKEIFKARGLNLTKDIYNMILNFNNIPNDMEMPNDLDEAKRDPENEDLWTLVYEELCPTSPNFARETKFPDISLGSRYGDDLIRIDRDNNIVVYGKDDAAFDFARQVCDVYGCTFDGLHKSGQFRVDSNGPDFTMYAKIKVPGYSD